MTNLASYIDHTFLKPDTTESDIKRLCEEAKKYKFASVCMASTWLGVADKWNESNDDCVNLCTVIGFPHGNSSIDSKTSELIYAMRDEAREVDVVVNIGDIKSGRWDMVEKEISELSKWTLKYTDQYLKYIVEVGYLNDDELFRVADLLIKHKVNFIKTCTGYGPRNVTVDDIIKIKKHVGDRIKIKASGGIKTYEFAKQLIDAGADRLGTSSSISIIEGAKPSSNDGAY